MEGSCLERAVAPVLDGGGRRRRRGQPPQVDVRFVVGVAVAFEVDELVAVQVAAVASQEGGRTGAQQLRGDALLFGARQIGLVLLLAAEEGVAGGRHPADDAAPQPQLGARLHLVAALVVRLRIARIRLQMFTNFKPSLFFVDSVTCSWLNMIK